jgi:NAD(P)-dependent dehydrogenase (short-subunit alcohol dehydrogenase family)
MAQKTALLTGATSGIGGAIARRLQEDGWRVVSIVRGKKISPDSYTIDLGDLQSVARTSQKIVSDLGCIDAFIHVAGMWHSEDKVLADKKLHEFQADEISQTMNVGVTSAMILLNSLLPVMDGGTVVGISGTFSDGAAGWLPYYTSKRALEDFLVGVSQDYPELHVYGVSPADTATPAYKQFYPQYFDESQPPEAVADLVWRLINGKTNFSSGDIIDIRKGKERKLFHG